MTRWIAGVELPKYANYKYAWAELSPSQRQKIVSVFVDDHKELPGHVTLVLPTHLRNRRQVWHAKLDAGLVDLQLVMNTWEQEYEAALAIMEAEQLEAATPAPA